MAESENEYLRIDRPQKYDVEEGVWFVCRRCFKTFTKGSDAVRHIGKPPSDCDICHILVVPIGFISVGIPVYDRIDGQPIYLCAAIPPFPEKKRDRRKHDRAK